MKWKLRGRILIIELVESVTMKKWKGLGWNQSIMMSYAAVSEGTTIAWTDELP